MRLNDATPEEWDRASRIAMERIKQEQYGKGYQDGWDDGYEAGRAEYEDALAAYEDAIANLPAVEVPEEVSEYARIQIEQGCINGGCDD